MRYFLELAYNGKAYHGWQNQPDAVSVQEVIEKALSTLLRKEITIVGAGRTDAGVHAKQMFAHFDYDEQLDSNLVFRLNSFLPKDIAIYDIFEVNEEAHTRFDATARTYEYWVTTRKDPFSMENAYLIHQRVDVEAMNEAAKVLFEYRDFKCFSKSNTDVRTYNCVIMKAEWEQRGRQLIFTVKADRFLRNMVRAIVGTLLEVGLGKSNIENVKKIIESKDRSNAGTSVPAHGLYLTEVTYPETIKIHG